MLRTSAVYLCLAVAASALAGCAAAPPYPDQTVYWGTFPQQPPDYSPDYASVPVVDRRGRTRYVLVPRACLGADPTEPPFLGPHCRRAAPTRITFSAWPSASPIWFAAARSAPLLRLRRRERHRNTSMAPRAPWAAAFRVRRAPRRRASGMESVTEKPAGTR